MVNTPPSVARLIVADGSLRAEPRLGTTMLLHTADYAFFVFHTLLIGFNMVGWAWPPARPYHLATVAATAFSWFGLGAWYGWGYCVCTDWHFRVREQLGYVDWESTYVQLLVDKLFGVALTRFQADATAGAVFGFILLATAVVWTPVLVRRARGS
ncbi:MAG: DUF2784 family protein [Planctomycetia bacterium]